MRKAKLWSMLLAAVLLCACIAGVLIMGASASDSRIPTATVTYTVDTDGSTIRECLSKATTAEWGKDDVLEIVSSRQDNSIVVTGTNKNRNLFWAIPTIFRADGTKLPIIIRGESAKINIRVPSSTAVRSYTAANDYYFTNVNFGTSMGGATIFAGSGKVVFENVSFTNSNTIKYYGDCDTMDAFVGWDADKLAANSNNGFLETGIVFGKDVTFSGSFGSDFLLAAVGFDGDATTNGEIFGYKVEAVNPTFTASNVDAVKAAAETATFAPGNNITSNCLVKPCNLSASVVLDNGKASDETYDYPRACARKGVSPVAKATVEMRSGDVAYIYGDDGSTVFNETFVGDTKVIFRGGYISSIRLATLSMWVGDMTVEVHEDSSTIPTYTSFIQSCPNPNTSSAPESATKLFGNYHFLMTGGTLGKGTEAGYYGALQATGTVVNEVRGGALSKFAAVRYGDQFAESTPISKTITLDEKHTVTLNETVTVHNKISGGIFGSLAEDGSVVAGTGFFAGADRSKHDYQPASVCNEISGGTFYNFTASGTDVTNKFESDIYNFISGNDTKFHCEFHGAGSTSVTNNVVNVIEGSPTFQSIDGTTNLDIYGGTTEGTVGTITNYLLGTPVFGNFSGGSKGATNAGVVDSVVSHISLGNTATFATIYGGNGSGNGANVVNQKLETSFYKGKFNGANIRAMSRAGTATCDTVFSIYGGSFSGEFAPVSGSGYGVVGSGYKVINNISGGTFGGRCLMGSKQNCRIAVENNVSGGTFNHDYVGAGRLGVASVTNNISGGEFNGNYYGGQDSGNGANNCTAIINNISGGEFNGAYYGGGAVSIGNAPITNTITGGIFNGVYYGGGAVSATTVANKVYAGTINNTWYGGLSAGDCTSITNNFYGGAGNADTNASIYCGSAATFTGTITNTFHAPGENGSGFDAKKSYVYGGGSANHANTTAESAILNTINGGTFIGFFGSNGGGAVDGKVKTVVNGGTFNPWNATNNNQNVVITGGTRGNGITNGDVTLEINGGTFNGEVVGGTTYTSGSTASGKTVNGNVAVTIKGGTFNTVNGRPLISGYTKSTYQTMVTMAEGKTATITGEQVAEQPLALYGEVEFDSFAANGEPININADTDIVIKELTGKIVLNQTEDWMERTYAILPANSECDVTESPAISGAGAPVNEDGRIVIKGFLPVKLEGATIRLADRLGVRFLLNIDNVNNIGAAFNYKVTMDDVVLAEGTKANLEEHQGYYSFVIDGIGLAQFDKTFKITSDFMTDETYSIVGLAELAQTAWANNAKWKAYADAIIEFHNVYNLGKDNILTYNEVVSTPSAEKGELGDEIVSAKATLLMSDAAGVRLTVTLNAAAPADAKFEVEGKEFAATVDGNTISADIFFSHEVLDQEFVISVQNAEGQAYMTYTASIEGMAYELATDDGNENQKNAQAFLCYIQKAVACR